MKVLLADRSHPGGIWNVLHPVAEALRDRGNEPVLVRWRDRPGAFAEAPDGVRVVQVTVPPKRGGPAGRLDVVRQLRAFAAAFGPLLEAERPDAVHANFVLPGAAVVRAAAGSSPKPLVVWTRHELFGSLSAPLRLLDRATRGRADVRTYVSRAVARSYGAGAEPPPAGGPVPADVVIHNGLDFAPLDAAAARARHDLGPRTDEIVCAARLVPVKGQATLIRALPAVIGAVPGARLTLFGEGPEEDRLRALADELGVSAAVTFAGWADRGEVWRRTAAGCAAVPSDGTQEGFGLSAAEAAALGGPVVVSEISVFREVLGGPAECGPRVAFAPPGDPAAWADRLVAALREGAGRGGNATGPADRGDRPGATAGAAGGAFVRRFSRAAMVAGYLRVYDAAG